MTCLSDRIEKIQRRAFRLYIRFNRIVTYFHCLVVCHWRKIDNSYPKDFLNRLSRLVVIACTCRILIPETRFHKGGRKLRNSENLDVFKCS